MSCRDDHRGWSEGFRRKARTGTGGAQAAGSEGTDSIPVVSVLSILTGMTRQQASLHWLEVTPPAEKTARGRGARHALTTGRIPTLVYAPALPRACRGHGDPDRSER